MKIAVIGSGNIGGGLAKAWCKAGHAVTFGARKPGDAELALTAKAIGASSASIGEAVKSAEVVTLAMPFAAIDEVIAAAGSLAGKIVIDCTNAVERGPGGMSLKYGQTTSAAEELQKKLPRAQVFKSFNAQGAENLESPVYAGVPASNFFCGDDKKARAVVKALVEAVGFEAIDAGPLKNARLLEPLMMLWMVSAQTLGTRDIAFKILRR